MVMPVDVFRKRLGINGKVLKFNFHGFYTAEGRRFLVVVHDGYTHFVFRMVATKRRGRWAIIGEVPGWVIEMEEELSDLIRKELSSDRA